MSEVEILPLMALTLLVGANAETKETRREIREFIQQVNPKFAYADEAANQLLYAQSVGGADAKLVAAMVAVERRWSLRPNPPYTSENLCQVLHSTGRRCFGRSKARSWAENLLWGSWYLQWCLQENDFNVTDALRAYNGGPHFARKPVTKKYARGVLRYRRKIGSENDN